MEKKEIELIDYLDVIWKRKWIIIIGTVLCMFVAGAVSFLLKPVYEIDTIIQPGKFFVENEAGNFVEFVVENPQQIADKVRYRSYDALIATELKLDLEEMPKIKGEVIQNTLLSRIWIKNHEVELSKKILDFLIVLLKKDIDEKINVEIKNIDTQITSKEREIKSKEISIDSTKIEKDGIKKEIATLRSKLKVIEKRKEEIITEMKDVKKRIDNLEENQVAILKKEDRSESETLGLLLYSNEIQQSLQYYNSLKETISIKELDKEDKRLEIDERKMTLKQLDKEIEAVNNDIENTKNQIANLKDRKGRIDYTKVVKEPTSSIDPVAPKKKLNVLIAAVLSLIGFTILAFFVEYIEKKKN